MEYEGELFEGIDDKESGYDDALSVDGSDTEE